MIGLIKNELNDYLGCESWYQESIPNLNVITFNDCNVLKNKKMNSDISYANLPVNDIVIYWINAVSDLKQHLYSVSSLNRWQILKKLYVHYKLRVKRVF